MVLPLDDDVVVLPVVLLLGDVVVVLPLDDDVVVLLHVREDAVEVERQRGDEVDNVDRCACRVSPKHNRVKSQNTE